MRWRTKKMQAENKLHFGVPIFGVTLTDFEERRLQIRDLLLNMQKSEGNQLVRSNYRGWHSRDNLHELEAEPLQWLTEKIYQLGCQYIHHVDKASTGKAIYLCAMWANINNYGDWNLPHAHFPCEWSGCVYIDVGQGSKESINGVAPGDIIFIDPLPMGELYGRSPLVGHTPINGRMFVFPGYLVHMVAPHYEQSSRISVAFNFRLAEPEK